MIKAAAGGGGRGRVSSAQAAEPDAASRSARREAKAAFGDDTDLCETVDVERPRHVEIQLLADGQGKVVALGGARVLDPAAPSEGALEESRLHWRSTLTYALGRARPAVCSPVRSVSQRGRRRVHAGRPRPLVPRADGRHSGRASGDRSRHGDRSRRRTAPHRSRRAARRGRARARRPRGRGPAVRRYPRSFLPQAGRIERLTLPRMVRVDAGVEEGDEIGVAYDPMIAKLIAHGPTRDEAFLPDAGRARRDGGGRPDDEPAHSSGGSFATPPCARAI